MRLQTARCSGEDFPRRILLIREKEGDGMYESPIEVFAIEIVQDIEEYINGAIVKECMRVGVNVNKDELIKALQYDRGQYQRGYFDGKIARDKEVVRCKDCKYLDHFCDEEIDLWCSAWENVTSEDGFCHYGRKEVEQ